MRGGALVEEVGVDGRTVKSESVLTVYHRRGVKRKLPGWTGQNSLTDRSHPECEKNCCPECPGKTPDNPDSVQTIRARIQTIQEFIMKKFLER